MTNSVTKRCTTRLQTPQPANAAAIAAAPPIVPPMTERSASDLCPNSRRRSDRWVAPKAAIGKTKPSACSGGADWGCSIRSMMIGASAKTTNATTTAIARLVQKTVSARPGVSFLARGMFCTMPWMAMIRLTSVKAMAMAKVPTSCGDNRRARITNTMKENIWSDAMRTTVHRMDQRVFLLRSSL